MAQQFPYLYEGKANLNTAVYPQKADEPRDDSSFEDDSRRGGGASTPSPLAGEGRGGGSTSRAASKIHQAPSRRDDGPESLAYPAGRSHPEKPFGERSKIFQPTGSQQSGPEFGPAPRSTGGAPGKRGGWKKR